MIEQKINYIHNNRVEEGIVVNMKDYKYSSAVDYYDGKGGLTIDIL